MIIDIIKKMKNYEIAIQNGKSIWIKSLNKEFTIDKIKMKTPKSLSGSK